ncbi:MAG: hypothetical protein ACREIP_04910 [Alphaproteobacteria bacterium]
MAAQPETTVTAVQKNDDGNWYYTIAIDGVEGPKVGPYETQEEAIAEGEEKAATSGDA